MKALTDDFSSLGFDVDPAVLMVNVGKLHYAITLKPQT